MGLSKPEINQLSEQQILEEPESNYMNDEQLAFFKRRLSQFYEETCLRIQETKDNMDNPIGISDANDRASCEEQSSVTLRIIDREQKLLPKIQKALERIRLGTYGYCLESEEPIGIPRLLARPTAEYCAEVKTLKEIKEYQYKD